MPRSSFDSRKNRKRKKTGRALVEHESLMSEGGGDISKWKLSAFSGILEQEKLSCNALGEEEEEEGRWMLIYHLCQETFPRVLPGCWLRCVSHLYFKSSILQPNCVQSFFRGISPLFLVSPFLLSHSMPTKSLKIEGTICNLCVFFRMAAFKHELSRSH